MTILESTIYQSSFPTIFDLLVSTDALLIKIWPISRVSGDSVQSGMRAQHVTTLSRSLTSEKYF